MADVCNETGRNIKRRRESSEKLSEAAKKSSKKISEAPKREPKIAYLWEHTRKPAVRDALNLNELYDLITTRDLTNKIKWNRNDIVSLANLLVGRRIEIDLNTAIGPPLSAFADRFEEESVTSLLIQKYFE